MSLNGERHLDSPGSPTLLTIDEVFHLLDDDDSPREIIRETSTVCRRQGYTPALVWFCA